MIIYLLIFIFAPALILTYWFAAWIVMAVLYVTIAGVLGLAIALCEFTAAHFPRRREGRFG